jgi:hypothetical protein
MPGRDEHRRARGSWAGRAALPAALSWALTTGAGSGAAQPAGSAPLPLPVRLSYVRAPGAERCPAEAYFRDRVTERFRGRQAPLTEDAAARLVVELAPDPLDKAQLRVRLSGYGADGALLLSYAIGPSRDCTALVDAAALSFAIQWDDRVPGAPEAAPAPTPGEAPSEGPAAAPSATSAPPPQRPPAPGQPPPAVPEPAPYSPPVCKLAIGGYCLAVDIYSFGFSAGALMTAGFTAEVGPGFWLAAELRPIEKFSFALEARGVLPSYVVATKPIDPSKPYGPPLKPDVSQAELLLVPCFRYRYFLGCVVGHFGFSMAQSPVELTAHPNYGLGPRLGLEIPFTEHLAARAYGDALFAFDRGVLEIRDKNLKWEQSVISGFFGIGLVISFK